MKRFIVTSIAALAIFAGGALGPGEAVADGCAATIEDASACGGAQLLSRWYTNHGNDGIPWHYDCVWASSTNVWTEHGC